MQASQIVDGLQETIDKLEPIAKAVKEDTRQGILVNNALVVLKEAHHTYQELAAAKDDTD